MGSGHGVGPAGKPFIRIHVIRRSGLTRPDLYLVSVLRPALCAEVFDSAARIRMV